MKSISRLVFVVIVGFLLLSPCFAFATIGAPPTPFPSAGKAYDDASSVVEVEIVGVKSTKKHSILGYDYAEMEIQWKILHVYKGQKVVSNEVETINISTETLCGSFSGTGGTAASGGGTYNCAVYLSTVGGKRLVYFGDWGSINLVLPSENYFYYKLVAIYTPYSEYVFLFGGAIVIALVVIIIKRLMKKVSRTRNEKDTKVQRESH